MNGDERFESLGDRMKSYEHTGRHYLTPKVPVIIRVDGRAFHSFTKGMGRPFDDSLIHCMQTATQKVAEEVSGCKFAYTQSDEASFLLTDFGQNTDGYFKYNKSKIETITASMFTLYFNEEFQKASFPNEKVKIRKAVFDARSFSISEEEVINYFIWRQWDATRNSIQMVARTHFSDKQCFKKNGADLQQMLLTQKDINWSLTETHKKRGTGVYKQYRTTPNEYHEKFPHNTQPVVTRGYWYKDLELPEFSKNKSFINDLLYQKRDKNCALVPDKEGILQLHEE